MMISSARGASIQRGDEVAHEARQLAQEQQKLADTLEPSSMARAMRNLNDSDALKQQLSAAQDCTAGRGSAQTRSRTPWKR